jgi:zinc protease
VVMAPDRENVQVPDTMEIRSIISQSKTQLLQPYVDNFKAEALVKDSEHPGKITNRLENKELGFTELKLSNGVTVVLKPTAYKNDEILVSSYSPGGKSLYPDDQYMSANYAAKVIDMSGAGNFNNVELQKKLKGKNLEVSPYIDDETEGIRANCAPKDIESMMQLIYLYITQPRKDSTAFKAFMSKMENQVKFMKSSPVMAFYDTLYQTVYPGYKRQVIFPRPERLAEVNLDQIYNIYRDRFADAGDFKFFMVGNFSLDSISPLIEQYFGSLPSLNRDETWKDTSPKFADGATNLTLNKGTDPQGMVGLVMSEKIEWNEKNVLCLNMIREILNIKLIEVIREKMSGVYSPQVMINIEQYPKSHYDLVVIFGCSPKATEKLTKAVFGEIKKLRKKGPSDTDLKKAQETMIRARETDLEKNDFWLGKLESLYYNHDSHDAVNTFKDRVNAITTGDLKQIATTCLQPEHYVHAVLMPEKK